MWNDFVSKLDPKIIYAFQKAGLPFARIAIFVVYFWFGILKLFGQSPANPLVSDLLSKTLTFISFENFILILGAYEVAIGIVFLIPKMERVAIFLLVPHLFVTAMPLLLLPAVTWQASFVPTIEGQYIIKNLLIIATAMGIAAHLEPIKRKNPA